MTLKRSAKIGDKAKIVDLYIRGYTPTEIEKNARHSVNDPSLKSGASVVVLFSSIPSPCESTYRFSTSKLTCPVVATSFESLQKNLSIVAGRMNNM